MKRNQSGFTLIEIAIVLVIIGLLLGGVLKGQELINSARVKNLATDFRNIPVYIYGYQDKFRALPGDDMQAASHVGGTGITVATCTSGSAGCNLGNGMIDGNWNDTTAGSESYLFWQQVRLAGLAAGSTDTTQGIAYLPTNAAGGMIGIQSGSTTNPPIKDATGQPIRGSYVICSTGILGKFAKQLDIQMDDGNTGTGSMIVGSPSAAAGTPMTAATQPLDDSTTYTVCMGV
jgi:prepilin-type N-terminal cleavage/methylation domain-containing protein